MKKVVVLVLIVIAAFIFIGVMLQIKYLVDKEICYDLPLTDFYRDESCQKFIKNR